MDSNDSTFLVGIVATLDDFKKLRAMSLERGFCIYCEGSLLAGYGVFVSEDALPLFATLTKECDVSGLVRVLRRPKRCDK